MFFPRFLVHAGVQSNTLVISGKKPTEKSLQDHMNAMLEQFTKMGGKLPPGAMADLAKSLGGAGLSAPPAGGDDSDDDVPDLVDGEDFEAAAQN